MSSVPNHHSRKHLFTFTYRLSQIKEHNLAKESYAKSILPAPDGCKRKMVGGRAQHLNLQKQDVISRSLVARSVAQWLGRPLARWLARSLARWLARTIQRSSARSQDHSISGRSVVGSLDCFTIISSVAHCSVGRLIARSLSPSLDRSVAPSLAPSLATRRPLYLAWPRTKA